MEAANNGALLPQAQQHLNNNNNNSNINQPSKLQPTLRNRALSLLSTTGGGNNPDSNDNKTKTSSAPSHLTTSITPPYWHRRDASRVSDRSADGSRNLITLEDREEDPTCEMGRGLWAKSVTIDDYVVVKGQTGIGAYSVWICNIQTLEGASMVVRMRYSEFVELRNKLADAFPHAKKAMPELPPKSVIFKFSKKFLETRRVGLAYFLNCVLLNPEFAGSPILKETLFTHST
ncbi:PX domain-containing protein ypt35 [Myotisia sp. PD_48]|nr:PX domain-containing protein ypt35 [Myotisia sp. PD_48]